ncbi:hypothetical protein [Bacillus sp. SN10]|uniref:hypothetical protein n=1 Tax=Bacillus sp. SN10 TaxID=2056493 RepID=UPI000C341C04|nr:hypothetical protein [Bacillus sp. SN10]PKJ54940.1 hypothetical protein CWE34_15310 [Bacillus sp. SN10]
MLEKRIPIPVVEAVARVMKYAHQGETEQVSLIESYGRTLGEDVIADHDVPHFDRSPYDGFAIRAEDTKEASNSNPTQFEVIGEIGAGFVFTEEVKAFQAVRIMTGAAIPKTNPFTRFVRGRVEIVDGQLQVTPVGLDKSSAISSLAEANAFIVLPGGTRGFEAGITVSVLLLESNVGSEWPWEEPLRSYK